MWMTRVAINHPVFATMVMVALSVLGIFSYQRLRVEAMPEIQFPFVSVFVQYPGASPEQIEQDVDGEQERTTLARINGQQSIAFQVYKAQDANIVEVGQALKSAADVV